MKMRKGSVVVYNDAFDWFADIRAGQDYGKKAAKAFAAAMRQDTKKNTLEGAWTDAGKSEGEANFPHVYCGDQMLKDWQISRPLDALIRDALRDAWEYQIDPSDCEAFAAALEKHAQTLRRMAKAIRKDTT